MLAKLIKDRREELDLTQEELALAAKLHKLLLAALSPGSKFRVRRLYLILPTLWKSTWVFCLK